MLAATSTKGERAGKPRRGGTHKSTVPVARRGPQSRLLGGAALFKVGFGVMEAAGFIRRADSNSILSKRLPGSETSDLPE